MEDSLTGEPIVTFSERSPQELLALLGLSAVCCALMVWWVLRQNTNCWQSGRKFVRRRGAAALGLLILLSSGNPAVSTRTVGRVTQRILYKRRLHLCLQRKAPLLQPPVEQKAIVERNTDKARPSMQSAHNLLRLIKEKAAGGSHTVNRRQLYFYALFNSAASRSTMTVFCSSLFAR